jgi:hypothetical protein
MVETSMKNRLLLFAWFLPLGCAYSPPHPANRLSSSAGYLGFHKVVVFCRGEDTKTERQFESDMVSRLQALGIEAIDSRKMFPESTQYSPHDMMENLKKSGIDGIMEIDTTAGSDSQPSEFSYHIHSINQHKPISQGYFNFLNDAMIALIEGLAKW